MSSEVERSRDIFVLKERAEGSFNSKISRRESGQVSTLVEMTIFYGLFLLVGPDGFGDFSVRPQFLDE
jgi:hypothetical protein